jgi:hypothetical protein
MQPDTGRSDTAEPADAADAAIRAELMYSVDTGVTSSVETFGDDNLTTRDTGAREARSVVIHDGRPLADQFALDRNGFVFVEHVTGVQDFFDKPRIPEVYYPEVEALIERVSGARRVVVFDHTLRSGDGDEREARQIRDPVLLVHNDYTEASGPRRVREVLPDEADALLQHRFAIIQMWRPIHRPVEAHPLAIADARSIAPRDLIVTERRYPYRIGEIYRVAYNPDHRWYYFPHMRRDEAVVFKVYDSVNDGRARFGAHTSFTDPTTPPGAAPRQSIEVRAFAFFAP